MIRAVLILSVVLLPGPVLAKPARNIVILYADDWRHDTLGIAGHPVVKTPRLDRMAREGVRFRHAYVTTAICGVSRASFLTGQWMSRHGNRAFEAFRTPWDETWPGRLRANGYYVGHIGKWHNGSFPAAHFDFGRSYGGQHFIKQPDGSTIHVTRKNELDALEFLRTRPADRPFSLTVSFFATHAEDDNPRQYLYQPESAELYRDVTIPVPPTAGDAFFGLLPPFIANEKNEGRNRWHWRFDTPDKYQEYMKSYYRLATEVDTVAGRILDELRSAGLENDTLVIFTTDNGYFHGEHGLADKWYPYEESIRVPLIIRDPRARRAGLVNDEMVLNVDLAPTILSFAGIAPGRGMQGRDLSTLYLNRLSRLSRLRRTPRDWRRQYFYEHATIRSVDFIPSSMAVVRRDIKYIYWPDFQYEELYDLRRDPRETRNLIRVHSYAGRLAELRREFVRLKGEVR